MDSALSLDFLKFVIPISIVIGVGSVIFLFGFKKAEIPPSFDDISEDKKGKKKKIKFEKKNKAKTADNAKKPVATKKKIETESSDKTVKKEVTKPKDKKSKDQEKVSNTVTDGSWTTIPTKKEKKPVAVVGKQNSSNKISPRDMSVASSITSSVPIVSKPQQIVNPTLINPTTIHHHNMNVNNSSANPATRRLGYDDDETMSPTALMMMELERHQRKAAAAAVAKNDSFNHEMANNGGGGGSKEQRALRQKLMDMMAEERAAMEHRNADDDYDMMHTNNMGQYHSNMNKMGPAAASLNSQHFSNNSGSTTNTTNSIADWEVIHSTAPGLAASGMAKDGGQMLERIRPVLKITPEEDWQGLSNLSANNVVQDETSMHWGAQNLVYDMALSEEDTWFANYGAYFEEDDNVASIISSNTKGKKSPIERAYLDEIERKREKQARDLDRGTYNGAIFEFADDHSHQTHHNVGTASMGMVPGNMMGMPNTGGKGANKKGMFIGGVGTGNYPVGIGNLIPGLQSASGTKVPYYQKSTTDDLDSTTTTPYKHSTAGSAKNNSINAGKNVGPTTHDMMDNTSGLANGMNTENGKAKKKKKNKSTSSGLVETPKVNGAPPASMLNQHHSSTVPRAGKMVSGVA